MTDDNDPTTLRLLLCPECMRLVGICEECDSNRVTCSDECRAKRRRRFRRDAGRRYQATPHGAAKHAERQRRYRERHRRVTHTAEPSTAPLVTSVTSSVNTPPAPTNPPSDPPPKVNLQCCNICQATSGGFIRPLESYRNLRNRRSFVQRKVRTKGHHSARPRRLGLAHPS